MKKQEVDTAKLLKLQDQLNVIVLAKDIKKCDEIKDPIYFTSCNVHILANQAIAEKKPVVCDKGTNDEIKQTCLGYYNQAIEAAKTPVTVPSAGTPVVAK